jgi:predicted phosphodiesterase
MDQPADNRLNRRRFLKASGAAVVTGMAGLNQPIAHAASAASSSSAAPLAFASAPLLLNPTAGGITIKITVNAPATGWIEYGPSESLGMRADSAAGGLEPYAEKLLSFDLAGLARGQVCHYRVHACAIDFSNAYSIHRGAQIQTPIQNFRTLDPAGDHASFTVWNDTHEHEETLRPLIAALAQSPTDFLFWNGDICNHIDDEQKILDQLLAPAGMEYASHVPLMIGRGNHDIRGRFARRLPDYVPGPGDRYFYQFRHGPIACLVMDSGEDKPDQTPAYAGLANFAPYRTQQRAWLERAIEQPEFQSARFRILLVHIPLVWEQPPLASFLQTYGSIRGWVCDDGKDKWHDLLVRGKVNVVISGHTHHHAWFAPNKDRPYGQLVGGGPQLERATIITASADQKRLEVTVKNVHGRELLKKHFDSQT